MLCSVKDCQDEVRSGYKGMCVKHYFRVKRNNTTERKNGYRGSLNKWQYAQHLERKRIIELLANKQSEDCKYFGCSLDVNIINLGEEDGHDIECSNWKTERLIALIKGEK